jgi:t-SNARE complex subunit (syntaxin)
MNKNDKDKEIVILEENDIPVGIRDITGYLLFFPKIDKYLGEEERYQREISERKELAKFLVKVLNDQKQRAIFEKLETEWIEETPDQIVDNIRSMVNKKIALNEVLESEGPRYEKNDKDKEIVILEELVKDQRELINDYKELVRDQNALIDKLDARIKKLET